MGSGICMHSCDHAGHLQRARGGCLGDQCAQQANGRDTNESGVGSVHGLKNCHHRQA